jgi:hypothetical protein
LAKTGNANVREISGILSQQLGNHLAILRESLDGSLKTDLGSRSDKDFTGTARFHGLRVFTMMVLVVTMLGKNETKKNGNNETNKNSLHFFFFFL